jgi:hypothetical protein
MVRVRRWVVDDTRDSRQVVQNHEEHSAVLRATMAANIGMDKDRSNAVLHGDTPGQVVVEISRYGCAWKL